MEEEDKDGEGEEEDDEEEECYNKSPSYSASSPFSKNSFTIPDQ